MKIERKRETEGLKKKVSYKASPPCGVAIVDLRLRTVSPFIFARPVEKKSRQTWAVHHSHCSHKTRSSEHFLQMSLFDPPLLSYHAKPFRFFGGGPDSFLFSLQLPFHRSHFHSGLGWREGERRRRRKERQVV